MSPCKKGKGGGAGRNMMTRGAKRLAPRPGAKFRGAAKPGKGLRPSFGKGGGKKRK